MNVKYILPLSVCMGACSGTSHDNINEDMQTTEVTLTHAVRGHIAQETILSATTAYQSKAAVAAPVASFVTEVRVRPGTRVRLGELLYRLESKEQHALGTEGSFIDLKAEHDGTVLDVQAQPGSYVAEGAVLCTVVETGSLVFEINVPYEQRKYAKGGNRCILELPDGTRLPATVQAPLATMNTVSQSEKVVALAEAPFLPEGLNVKAIFTSEETSETVTILPKSAVQSDETLTEHWIMKLSADSTSVRVPVEVGNSSRDSIEILSPSLSPQEQIIRTGGYGLADGAKVTVTQ